jgi:DNA-binding CsgD family transcriptional regulator
MKKEYALYKGEEILCIGSISEIAIHENIKRETVLFYNSKAHKKRISKRESTNSKILICLD